LIRRLLKVNPLDRLSAAQVLHHPFLKVAHPQPEETPISFAQRFCKVEGTISLSHDDPFSQVSEDTNFLQKINHNLPVADIHLVNQLGALSVEAGSLEHPPSYRRASDAGCSTLSTDSATCVQNRRESSQFPETWFNFEEPSTNPEVVLSRKSTTSATFDSTQKEFQNTEEDVENQPVRVRLCKRFSVDNGIVSLLSVQPAKPTETKNLNFAKPSPRLAFGEVTNSVINKR
jgi:serine/threonine protein kinase